ncbi:CLUMA_CG007094, isoform A [Clunio marinus]|uniref:CLUMA_CG007094, isoform A n=1 Tax=Clunio marinus TaxID=568069 RepID=A0A1J1I5A7_9DIPT|nr:CLUMA_CG007094, isoform A [Clunio marinus]
MKLLHLLIVVIITKEVFSGGENLCSSPPLSFSPSAIAERLSNIKDFVNDVSNIYLPFFQGQEDEKSDQERVAETIDIFNSVLTLFTNNGITISLDNIITATLTLVNSLTSTGIQKKIDKLEGTLNIMDTFLVEFLTSILEQIASETGSNYNYVSEVAAGLVDPVDYPISCILDELTDIYQFVSNIKTEIENIVNETVEELEKQL